MNIRLVDQSVEFKLHGQVYQAHVTILAGNSAVIFRGVDDKRLSIPILCDDSEALCYELLEWRERVGLSEPEPDLPPNLSSQELAEAIFSEMEHDPFPQELNDLAYRVEALSLIESLP